MKGTKSITLAAMMLALLFVANCLDKLYSQWLVAGGGAALAVAALITLVMVALSLNDWRFAIFAGAAFGFISFVSSFIFYSPIFQNPLVSVVPRLFVGLIGFGGYKFAGILFRSIQKSGLGKVPMTLPIALTALCVVGIVLISIYLRGWVFYVTLSAAVLMTIFFASIIIMRLQKSENAAVGGETFALTVGAALTIIANTGLVLPMMFLTSSLYGSLADVFAVLTIINFLPELIITSIAAPVVITGVRRGLRLGTDGRPKKRAAPAPEATDTTESGNVTCD